MYNLRFRSIFLITAILFIMVRLFQIDAPTSPQATPRAFEFVFSKLCSNPPAPALWAKKTLKVATSRYF